MLECKNLEIKLKNAQRNIEILNVQNKKFSDTINEIHAKMDNLQRDLHTQKEIMRQFEIQKKELVGRLRRELDTVEERFLKIINQNNMVGEDYRMRAAVNFERLLEEKLKCQDLEEQLEIRKILIA
jgi:multidrug resistance efflux pump